MTASLLRIAPTGASVSIASRISASAAQTGADNGTNLARVAVGSRGKNLRGVMREERRQGRDRRTRTYLNGAKIECIDFRDRQSLEWPGLQLSSVKRRRDCIRRNGRAVMEGRAIPQREPPR